MTVIASDDVRLRMEKAGVFEDVAGIRKRRFQLKRRADMDSTALGAAWSEASAFLEPASADLRLDGLFVSGDSAELVRDVFVSGDAASFELKLPGDGVWSGSFLIRELTLDGKAEGELKFELRMASTGPVVFTPDTGE